MTVTLTSVGALLITIASWLPDDESSLRVWLVIPGAVTLFGAFCAYMTLNKLREDAGRFLRQGSVRKVSCGVRKNYRAFTKAANINPCDEELFDYDKESQTVAEALDAKFRARHGRERT